jgi:hypothetical protein
MIGSDPDSCINRFLSKLFIPLRLVAALFFLGFVLYMIAIIDYQTVSINFENWWKTKEEPFLTNASYYNAGICWILNLLALFTMPFQSMIIVFNLIFCCKKNR